MRDNLSLVAKAFSTRAKSQSLHCKTLIDHIAQKHHIYVAASSNILVYGARGFERKEGQRCQQLLQSCRPSRIAPIHAEAICRPVRSARTPWWLRKRPLTSRTTSSAISGPATPAVTAS